MHKMCFKVEESGGKWNSRGVFTLFYGEYSHTVDNKGRLIIPARFRSTLRDKYIDKFYITQGLERCIFVYAEHEWNILQQKFKALPMTKKKVRDFSRMFFSRAFEALCDKQGRINVPSLLLEYACIQKEVVVVGVLDRFEIWERQSWQDYVGESSKTFEEIAEDLVDLNTS